MKASVILEIIKIKTKLLCLLTTIVLVRQIISINKIIIMNFYGFYYFLW